MADTSLAIPDLEDKRILGLAERFQPQNLTELMTWAKLVDKSGLAPKGMNEAAIVLCVQMGAELRITPTQALQNIAVINGRPSIFGDLGLALFKRDSGCKSFQEDAPDVALKQGFGRCTIVTKEGKVIERKFSIEEAKTARLWMKEGPWTNYPGRQLMFRARWWAMRDAEPGVFKGIGPREEVEDIVDVTDTATSGGAPLRAPRERSGTPTVTEVEAFVKDVKPAPGAPAAIDRSKLETVLINGVERKSSGKSNWFEIAFERSNGEASSASTFSTTDGPLAESLKGDFALISTKVTERTKDGITKKYNNLVHIEAAPAAAAADVPPAGDEPGSNG